jgi:hypothetical protein
MAAMAATAADDLLVLDSETHGYSRDALMAPPSIASRRYLAAKPVNAQGNE